MLFANGILAMPGGYRIANLSDQLRAQSLQLPRDVRDRRLLLCLYGLGTNAGLKRIAAGTPDASHDDLLYIRRRFIDNAAIRRAITEVASATLAVRDPAIWGEAGTACASDSTKFGCQTALKRDPLLECAPADGQIG